MRTVLVDEDELRGLRLRAGAYDRLLHDVVGQVLGEVQAEVQQQQERYGKENALALDGTGPEVCWLPPEIDGPLSATAIEAVFRLDYEYLEHPPTWMHLVREEVAEAFKEKDLEPLAEELTQAAALIVNWLVHIRQRPPVIRGTL